MRGYQRRISAAKIKAVRAVTQATCRFPSGIEAGLAGADTSPHSRGAIRARGAVRHPRDEGAGNAGCALHPRSRVQNCASRRTRAYRFSGNTPASPAQWLYGLWRALPGDEFFFVTVAAGSRPKRPGWIAFATDSLTP